VARVSLTSQCEQNLRAVYDKHGIEEVGPLNGNGGVEDPSAFFAQVFGGDRFNDYVSHSHYSIIELTQHFYRSEKSH